MQFNFCEFAGDENLSLQVKEYSHIFKVRRVSSEAEINFANLKDDNIYSYKINSINKKEASLVLVATKESKKVSTCKLHVGWCVVDPKTVEKNIAMLNSKMALPAIFRCSDDEVLKIAKNSDKKNLHQWLNSMALSSPRWQVIKALLMKK